MLLQVLIESLVTADKTLFSVNTVSTVKSSPVDVSIHFTNSCPSSHSGTIDSRRASVDEAFLLD